MNQNLLPHELRSTVTRIAAVLNRNNIDYAIMGGAAICLLGVNIGRSTADVDLVIHVDERAITAEAVSSILLEEKDFKPILQYGVTIPGFCVQRPENNDLVVEIEIFDQLAWPERPQYDLKQASCTTLILDNQEVKIFSPEWLLREKIATYYQRRNSLKSDSDLGDVLDLLEIVVPNSPELDFTNSSELKEALGEFLANAPESRVLVAEKIKF